jgi:hypothetical protein
MQRWVVEVEGELGAEGRDSVEEEYLAVGQLPWPLVVVDPEGLAGEEWWWVVASPFGARKMEVAEAIVG